MKTLIILAILLPSWVNAQKRMIVTPNEEIIPIRQGQSAVDAIRQNARKQEGGSCSNPFLFGYTTDLYPFKAGIQMSHKQVIAEWFVAKSSGVIDSIFFISAFTGLKVDSEVSVRIFRSNIFPGRGPGFGPYRSPCTPWGYYADANDSDQGITPFRDEATDTAWTSTAIGDSTSFDPLGAELWGRGGYTTTIHDGIFNVLPMSVTGETLRVNCGDVFFVTMRMNSPNMHLPDSLDIGASLETSTFTTDASGEEYPSRLWKFYEHDSGPSNCLGTLPGDRKRGWIARGGFGNDTLEVAAWNLWYAMTVTTNTPPNILSVTRIQSTIDPSPQRVDADISDCDPGSSAHAGVKRAYIKWRRNGDLQPDILMSIPDTLEKTLWEGLIPVQLAGTTISYSVIAEDSSGLTSSSPWTTYDKIGNSFFSIDSASGCLTDDISSTGTIIPDASFFLPPIHNFTAPTDDGTAGPFDLGSEFLFFGKNVRYAWIGVNGALALTESPTDTIDINSNGLSAGNIWWFPYYNTLRTARDASIFVMNNMPANYVSVLGSDLTLTDSAGTHYGHVRHERAPGGDSCKFVIEWDSLGTIMSPGRTVIGENTRFRVVVNRCAGTLEYQYDKVGAGRANSLAAMGGGTLNDFAILCQFSSPGSSIPHDRFCVRFSPSGLTGVQEHRPVVSEFRLLQNFPNPFNPITTLSYFIGSSTGQSWVTLKIYDVIGREVATLVNEEKGPGEYSVRWDATNVGSGVYSYVLRAGTFVDVKRMVVIK